MLIAWVVEELSNLFIGHYIPDAIGGQNEPFRDEAALFGVHLWVVGEACHFWLSDDSSLLCKNVS